MSAANYNHCDWLNALLILHQRMLEAAESGDWLEVEEGDRARVAIVDSYIATQTPSYEQCQAAISAIQNYNQQITVLARARQQQLADKLSQLSQTRNGCAAYLNNA